MSAPKHTPGPWHATGTGIVKDEQGRSLAIIQAPRGEIPLAEAVANGELMASAPELASRIANLESLLAEKQRQCDVLTDALDAETNKCVNLRRALVECLSALNLPEPSGIADTTCYTATKRSGLLAQARLTADAALRDGRAEPIWNGEDAASRAATAACQAEWDAYEAAVGTPNAQAAYEVYSAKWQAVTGNRSIKPMKGPL